MVSGMNVWAVLLTAGAITFATRLSSIVLIGKLEMPHLVQRTLRFVPPAVLTAIFIPELLFSNGELNLTLGNLRLFAGALAILVAWRTKNIVLTILAGMLTLWILQALI
jgi:branched-subunit amino acid transport protein